ncbi:hypothetical protein [Desulfonatronum lacustre]|uniref:hypothetical protein n=1 Tax=Desulfonatronum lacustre TaxID=66849 RepID=UPI001FE188A4|nr:hypothetical protein [Desulfonatronum lacustre]
MSHVFFRYADCHLHDRPLCNQTDYKLCVRLHQVNESPSALTQAARLIRVAVSSIDDIRASADYRRQVAGNFLLRLG